jgi:hypothetical protein
MNSSRVMLIGAIRGPILLITLGTLFTVDHFGSLSFWRTWPVLIIVFGVMKLLEKTLGEKPSAPNAMGGVAS